MNLGLRVHFENVSLPAGSELWVYTMDGMVRGPHTATGPNGNVDEGCPSTCTPSGDHCTSNAERCSGRCRPAKNFCR